MEKIIIWVKTENGKSLCFFILGLLCFYLIGRYHMNTVLSNPVFTVGKIQGIHEGTKGTNYVIYEYLVNSKIIVCEQSRSIFSGGKRRLKATKGNKYLVVYNKEKPKNSHMINIKLTQEMGTDLSSQYSVDSLKKIGLISVGDF